MIHGIGTDIVAIARMTRLWDKYAEALAARLLADDEQLALQHHADPARFLAKRFAAKEAAAKALGTGFRGGLSLRHIAVVNDALGKPTLRLDGRAAELAADFGVRASHVSISDEADYAVAFVVMTR
ncbi:MAG: holo-ACP synthase [Gammaproteobacteria bacterium 28-57-27]|nr:MAG: holo-ACP synthase [Gammaproteobacteria bacterium 28-57-27]